MKKTIFASLVFIMINTLSFAQDEILGTWYNTKKDGKVLIEKVGDNYVGKIVWIKEPIDENTGKPKTDILNPDDARHQTPIIGLKVLTGFEYSGDNVWEDGKIYDPENGKTYSCKMTLKDDNNLDVRGFIGFSLLGRTEYWTRAVK